jgi:hypothetical protein
LQFDPALCTIASSFNRILKMVDSGLGVIACFGVIIGIRDTPPMARPGAWIDHAANIGSLPLF